MTTELNIWQERVREFHIRFNLSVNDLPTVPNAKDRALRIKLIEEELREFKKSSEDEDIIGIADDIADILYVVLGAAVTWGININPVFNEVHRSNMTKIWDDGEIHITNYGKVIKPDTYSKPDIKSIIEEQAKG